MFSWQHKQANSISRAEPTLTPGLAWSSWIEDGGQIVITLSGVLDERAFWEELREKVTGPAVFDLSQISQITSLGVSAWITFMRAIEQHGPHALRRCSPRVVDQLNQIANFSVAAHVQSVMAPYFCGKCDRAEKFELQLNEFNSLQVTIPQQQCSRCQSPMEFDDIPGRFFAFLGAH